MGRLDLTPGVLALVMAVTAGLAGMSAHAEEAPRAGYEYWIPVSESDSAGQHGIHFTEFVNGSARLPKHPFSFQRWDDPQLGELKRRLNLDSLLAGARDDLEQVSRIALMICNRWAHAAPIEYPVWNALEILDNVDQGEQYWCTYKQLVAMQAFAAIGLHSRIVPCHWHHALEYWSDDYGKWVIIDAWTGNLYRKNGIPSGALELHKLSRESGSLAGSGVWEINLNPNRWFPWRTADSTLAETGVYRHIRYIPRNDFLSAPLAPKPAGAPGTPLQMNSQLNDLLQTGLPHIGWWQPGDPPILAGTEVRYEQDWNFPLNEVEIDLRRPGFTEGVLDLEFKTHTPEFDTYLVRMGDCDWRPSGSRILWELETGKNRLEVVSRNKWGRRGPKSVVELRYEPAELAYEAVESIQVPDSGFEEAGGYFIRTDSLPADSWHLIVSDQYQLPKLWGPLPENPNNGTFCWRIELADPPIWAKLSSARFRVNPASDVRLTVWLRAESDRREVTLFVMDNSPGGAGRQAVSHTRATVDRQWRPYRIETRLGTQTTHVSVGIQVMSGTVWADDFRLVEIGRAELPWGK
ncbi:MAG: hypothetical protein FVQ81_08365 [Candidatus Glassbacteria bacterium]|nr:hypothetical protein [Candidatus Glassbacteria bacterium]